MNFQEYKKELLKKLPDTIKVDEVDEYIAKIQEEQLFWKNNGYNKKEGEEVDEYIFKAQEKEDSLKFFLEN